MRIVVLLLAVSMTVSLKAQSWQQVYDEMMTIDDDEESGELLYDNYELMEQLAAHPLDLNSVTREELEQLPFLSSMQVMDIAEYLDRYGPMRSLGELRMIRSEYLIEPVCVQNLISLFAQRTPDRQQVVYTVQPSEI